MIITLVAKKSHTRHGQAPAGLVWYPVSLLAPAINGFYASFGGKTQPSLVHPSFYHHTSIYIPFHFLASLSFIHLAVLFLLHKIREESHNSLPHTPYFPLFIERKA